MGGLIDKIKGKVKEVTGAATGDRSLEAEGKKDHAKGHVKQGYENLKHDVRDTLDRDRNRH
ncbi:MAG TPA: CsbD family protein [Myxococcaceae bacterium]|jgi:uncharacterized protein YjbJ (UPF0337 family)|nr:CsbD family protein [Myxococcaceae bacterium]